VGYSSFPRKREPSGSKTSEPAPLFKPEPALAKAGGQALDTRFRGGDDTLLTTLASFQVRHLLKLTSKLYGRSILPMQKKFVAYLPIRGRHG
jgi:hypothetical protein